jgi:hypothetical protein
VAVLDESGAILYASRAWRLFEQSVDAKAQPSDVFARCLRADDAALSTPGWPVCETTFRV